MAMLLFNDFLYFSSLSLSSISPQNYTSSLKYNIRLNFVCFYQQNHTYFYSS